MKLNPKGVNPTIYKPKIKKILFILLYQAIRKISLKFKLETL